MNSIPRRTDIQIIVVDDNNDPKKVDFEHFPGVGEKCVKVYFTKEGKGAGYARNMGRFLWTNCCDEIFFHIIVMNSPYKNQIFPNNLRYIDWTDKGRGSLPLTLIKDDFEQILAKDDCFFCRKIQPHVSDELIAMILNYKNGK